MALDLLEREVQVVVGCPMWVLGTEKSSKCSLNHLSISDFLFEQIINRGGDKYNISPQS